MPLVDSSRSKSLADRQVRNLTIGKFADSLHLPIGQIGPVDTNSPGDDSDGFLPLSHRTLRVRAPQGGAGGLAARAGRRRRPGGRVQQERRRSAVHPRRRVRDRHRAAAGPVPPGGCRRRHRPHRVRGTRGRAGDRPGQPGRHREVAGRRGRRRPGRRRSPTRSTTQAVSPDGSVAYATVSYARRRSTRSPTTPARICWPAGDAATAAGLEVEFGGEATQAEAGVRGHEAIGVLIAHARARRHLRLPGRSRAARC